MTENTENITRRGTIFRVVIAAFFFIAAAAGVFMIFGQAAMPVSDRRDFKADAEPLLEIKAADKLFMIMVGDIMIDRNVLKLTKQAGDYSYPFKKIDGYLDQADLRVGNLEGPITDNQSVSILNNGMRFTFPTDYLAPLSERFEVLGIGNNHALDFGEDGSRQTKANLTREGILSFGDYFNRGDNSTVIKKNGIKIGFVGYNALTEKNLDTVLIDVAKFKAMCDFVIAMPHWGEEYELRENLVQKEAAKKMIDAGADVVVGGHPHVTQPLSVYKGKAIFWSLGNFVFDQYFSEETMRSISATVELTRNNDGAIRAEYGIIPIEIGRDSQPVVMNSEKAKLFLKRIAKDSDISERGKSDVESGKFDPLSAEKIMP